MVAAPHLFVIRLRAGGLVVPDYLTWFLNLPETQDKIRALRSGSAVPFVPMTAFARLEVPVPRAERQAQVADLQRLCLQEQRLLGQIMERRRVLMDGLMREAVRRETDHVAESRKLVGMSSDAQREAEAKIRQ